MTQADLNQSKFCILNRCFQVFKEKKRKLAEMWDSPRAREVLQAVNNKKKDADTRDRKLQRALTKVQQSQFASQLQGLTDLLYLKMTWAEATEMGAGKVLGNVLRHHATQLPVKLAAKQLLDA